MSLVYLSGPISNQPDGNRGAFAAAQVYFEAQGHTVLNPHVFCKELERTLSAMDLTDDEKWRYFMRACIREVTKAHQLFALDGWNDSRGAMREVAVAEWLGIPVRYQTEPNFVNMVKYLAEVTP